jgi:hypothetical protein
MFGTTSSFNAASPAMVEQEGNPSATDEVQTVHINGSPTGGTFTLTFQGQTTAGIVYNASAADLKTALEALSNITAGDLTVILSGTTYTVTFGASVGGMDLAQKMGDASSVTGGAVPAVTTQEATAATNEVQRISFSQPPGEGTFTLSWNPGGGTETTGPSLTMPVPRRSRRRLKRWPRRDRATSV